MKIDRDEWLSSLQSGDRILYCSNTGQSIRELLAIQTQDNKIVSVLTVQNPVYWIPVEAIQPLVEEATASKSEEIPIPKTIAIITE